LRSTDKVKPRTISWICLASPFIIFFITNYNIKVKSDINITLFRFTFTTTTLLYLPILNDYNVHIIVVCYAQYYYRP
jgi:hypothetical protein